MKHLEIIHRLGQADSREAAVAFDEFLRGAVRQSLVSVMAEEVTSLRGAAYGRDTESPSRRAGSAPSSLEIEGEKISRLRVRREHSDGTKSEVKLASYEAAKGYEKNKIRDAIIFAPTPTEFPPMRCRTRSTGPREPAPLKSAEFGLTKGEMTGSCG